LTARSWAKWWASAKCKKPAAETGRNFAQLVLSCAGGHQWPGRVRTSPVPVSFNPRGPASNFNALGKPGQYERVDWSTASSTTNTPSTRSWVQPSVESIAEFKVLTGSYAANYGVGRRAFVSVSTPFRREPLCTVRFFLYLRNSAVDARNYFARVGGAVQKPAYPPRPIWRRRWRGNHQGQAVLLLRITTDSVRLKGNR